jgi:dCMP deaminase
MASDYKRPSWDDYYLGIARAVAGRSPCLRRKVGAIIVVSDAIVSTGYNGPARGVDNCSLGCLKDKKDAPVYAGYNWCPAVHAEENAIINAARNGVSVLGGTLYLVGVKPDGTPRETVPCRRCSRALINAGVEREGKQVEIKTADWVREDNDWYHKGMKG